MNVVLAATTVRTRVSAHTFECMCVNLCVRFINLDRHVLLEPFFACRPHVHGRYFFLPSLKSPSTVRHSSIYKLTTSDIKQWKRKQKEKSHQATCEYSTDFVSVSLLEFLSFLSQIICLFFRCLFDNFTGSSLVYL